MPDAKLVIDASVAGKLYFEEEFSEIARQLVLFSRVTLIAPDHIVTEISNIAWKQMIRRTITAREAETIVDRVCVLRLEKFQCSTLLPLAIQIACKFHQTIYDSLYLSLAARERALLITADERLIQAMRPTIFGRHIRFIGDL